MFIAPESNTYVNDGDEFEPVDDFFDSLFGDDADIYAADYFRPQASVLSERSYN